MSWTHKKRNVNVNNELWVTMLIKISWSVKTRKPSCRWQTHSTRKHAESWGTPSNINKISTSMTSKFSGLQFRRWHYRPIFIRLADVASQHRKIMRNSDKIWPYSSSRSSKVVDLGVNRKLLCMWRLYFPVRH